MGRLRALLDLSDAVLEVSWALLGLSWAVLGASEALLGLTWAVLGRKWPKFGLLDLGLRLPTPPPPPLLFLPTNGSRRYARFPSPAWHRDGKRGFFL